MSQFRRTHLPVDIAVFTGDFASQPLVFTHLLDIAPDLELEHVEVIQGARPLPRLVTHFDEATAQTLMKDRGARDTFVLILPAAYQGLTCPFAGSERLIPLGQYRGTIPRMIAR